MGKRPERETVDAVSEYREESARIPFVVMAVLVLMIGLLLGWTIFKIDTEGFHAVNVSKYSTLIQAVSADTQAVAAMLEDGSTEMMDRKRTLAPRVPKEVPVVEIKPAIQSPLAIELKGIYWNPVHPLVDIDNEIYREGDTVQGYAITKIGKRSVQFKAKDGGMVVKGIYEEQLEN